MPELPELEVASRRLGERLVGRQFVAFELGSISALKSFEPSLESLTRRLVTAVTRRGKNIVLALDGELLAFNLARSGWVHYRERLAEKRLSPSRGPLALRARLDPAGGFELVEHASEKRLAIWTAHQLSEIESVASLGPEPLSDQLSLDAFAALCHREQGDLKRALTRQSFLAGIGNAYSDEILHAAKLSPFKRASALGEPELLHLYEAMRSVLTAAVTRAEALELDELKDSKRRAMSVHGRTGEPCPACGDTVAEVSYATRSLQYCPSCQTGGRRLADRRLSRLLR